MEWKVGQKRKESNFLVEQLGYSDSSNPFNDANLTKSFEWKLRDNKLRNEGKDPKQFEEEQKQHVLEDLHKAKKRRQEREAFEQTLRLIKERDARLEGSSDDPSLDWSQFEFDQDRKRAIIRLQERRERPIDVLYAITQAEEDVDFRIPFVDPPHKLIKSLTPEERQTLMRELRIFLKYDVKNPDYWKSLIIICENEIATSKIEERIQKDVIKEIKEILKGQSLDELDSLEKSIQQKIQTQSETIDVEYWERLLHLLNIKRAKIRSKTFFQRMMRSLASNHSGSNSGRHNSRPLPPTQAQIQKAADMYQREAEKHMGEGEEAFNADLPMTKQYTWSDQYQSRKPTFFNRVIKGYDWNRYNQTHFTSEDPPPPTIRGYRFNIFYPDLVDPSEVPNYTLHPSDNPDEMIIVFHAGAPYEDLAFRIHNGDWDYSRKSGFRCSFENGVLRLWFNFKRYRYRR